MQCELVPLHGVFPINICWKEGTQLPLLPLKIIPQYFSAGREIAVNLVTNKNWQLKQIFFSWNLNL